MAEEERFERWEPIDGLSSKMYIDGMYDDREGFRLILKSTEPKMRSLRIFSCPPLLQGRSGSLSSPPNLQRK